MNGRYHSPQFKLELVKHFESGEKRPAQVCPEHNIAESSLLKWRKEYAARGEAAFTPRQVDELCKLLGVNRAWFYQQPKRAEQKARQECQLVETTLEEGVGIYWLRLPPSDKGFASAGLQD
jgi:transposase-like protein